MATSLRRLACCAIIASWATRLASRLAAAARCWLCCLVIVGMLVAPLSSWVVSKCRVKRAGLDELLLTLALDPAARGVVLGIAVVLTPLLGLHGRHDGRSDGVLD